MTAATQPMPKRRKRRHAPAIAMEWTYETFGIYGVKYADAMKAAADMRRELVRRLEEIDKFLAMPEQDYAKASEDKKRRPAIDMLNEIRGWFGNDLDVACRVLKLNSYEVAEKAAIYEYDCGYTRRQSEIMALRDFLQFFGRYDGRVKEMVDNGLILDIARDLNNDLEAERLIRQNLRYPVHPLPAKDSRVIELAKERRDQE